MTSLPFQINLPEYARGLYSSTLGQLLKYVELQEGASLTIGEEGSGSAYEVSAHFLSCLEKRTLDHGVVFDKQPAVFRADGKPDHLSTLVYMANYLQEYGKIDRDELGRFRYESSYQHKYGIVRENRVVYHMKQCLLITGLGKWKDQTSRIFVSHDNDGLFRGLKQDGMLALKRGRIDWFVETLISELKGKPRWFNMDQIMDINEAYGIKSTFFWLVEKGAVQVGARSLRNADYSITKPRILRQIKGVESRGFENGLHKAIGPKSFRQEMALLPFSCRANRNHFLKLSIPEHFKEIDDAGLDLDFSLGFAEMSGLRNNFALPFKPYDLNRMCTVTATYIPLMVMDTTNWSYIKERPDQFRDRIIEMLNMHKKNAVISVLWHNKYFTDMKFKGYPEVYKSILQFCVDNGIEGIDQKTLISEFGSQWG